MAFYSRDSRTQIESLPSTKFDARNQVKSCVADDVDAFGNSCALETPQWLAVLDRNIVRAALRSRAQPIKRTRSGSRFPLFTLCGVLLCSLRSITQAAHQARARTPDAHARQSGGSPLKRSATSHAGHRAASPVYESPARRPFRYSAHASDVTGYRMVSEPFKHSGWRMIRRAVRRGIMPATLVGNSPARTGCAGR